MEKIPYKAACTIYNTVFLVMNTGCSKVEDKKNEIKTYILKVPFVA
jgi:hypothetical protein